jgi:hypothetical protein
MKENMGNEARPENQTQSESRRIEAGLPERPKGAAEKGHLDVLDFLRTWPIGPLKPLARQGMMFLTET